MNTDRTLQLGVIFAIATMALSCGKPDTGLDEDCYIEVMAQLTLAHVRFMETPQEDSARASVLNDFSISGDELLEFAEVHGGDVVMMDRIWEEVRLRVATLENAPVLGSGRATLQVDSLMQESPKP